MKLYFTPGACSLAVRILINELNLPSEYEAVNLATKKTATGADYLTINPKGAVPALVLDNGHLLTENAVIQQYLADLNHASRLLPPIPEFKRYQVLEWLNFITTDLHKGASPLFNREISEDIKESIFKPAWKKKLAHVDQHLAKHTYIVGEDYMLPDGYLFVMLTWTFKFKIDFNDLKNLTRYFELLKKRDSIQKSLEEEGLKL